VTITVKEKKMKRTNKELDDLFFTIRDELIDLAEKYKDGSNPAQFCFVLASFAAEIALDCSPSVEEALSVIESAIELSAKEYIHRMKNK
jgi:hypothetical protein